MLNESFKLVLSLCEEQVSKLGIEEIEEEVLIESRFLLTQVHVYWCGLSIDVLVIVVYFFKEIMLFSQRFLLAFKLQIIVVTEAASFEALMRQVRLEVMLERYRLYLLNPKCFFSFPAHIKLLFR